MREQVGFSDEYTRRGAALTLDNSVIAGNGGYDFAGTLGSVQDSNVYYGSRMAEFWEADFTQVNDPSTVIGNTVREKTVRGVQQAYYDLQVNLPPAPRSHAPSPSSRTAGLRLPRRRSRRAGWRRGRTIRRRWVTFSTDGMWTRISRRRTTSRRR